MTSKEALKQYKEIYVDKTLKFEFQPAQEWYLDIIKQDLDRLYELEQANNSLRAFIGNLQTCREREARKIKELKKKNQKLLVNKNVAQGIATKFKEENHKLKQALEILKDKLWVYEHNGYRISMNLSHDYFSITQEEYNLLKEVLGNE